MKINKLLLAMIAVSLAYTSGCKKKTVYISDIVQKHFYYKPGSYWVYVDTVTGKYDSVSVESATSYIAKNGKDAPYEVITINMPDRTNTNLELTETMSNGAFIKFSVIKNGRYTNGEFSYPFTYSAYSTIQIFQNYTFRNVNYGNVLQIHEDGSYWFISDSVGMLQYYNDSVAWELARFRIII